MFWETFLAVSKLPNNIRVVFLAIKYFKCSSFQYVNSSKN